MVVFFGRLGLKCVWGICLGTSDRHMDILGWHLRELGKDTDLGDRNVAGRVFKGQWAGNGPLEGTTSRLCR